jgi:Protein of unknown function (DUF1573)
MNTFWVFILIAGLVSCKNSETKKEEDPLLKINLDSIPETTVLILDTAINFGTIKEGENITSEFRFVNTGQHPLIIQSANASCGCTVAEKPMAPILPGDTGSVKTTYSSKGRGGEIVYKTITVFSNADTLFKPLILRGKVEKSNK